MQVSVETISALGRKMTVQVPAERVESEIDKRLQSLTRTVQLAGFRPGKIPLRVVKQRFGEQVRREVTGEILERSFREAITQEQLKPAGGPRIEPRALGDQDRSLEYTATFEVYPEFEIAPVDTLQIKRPQTEVTDADVDTMIEKLRQQRRTWQAVARVAAQGDRITVDFKGTLAGQPFAGGEGENVAIELGTGRMLAGFEEPLLGTAADDERRFEVTFPQDYFNQELAGQTAHFEVKIKEVAEAHLPEVGTEFARAFGIKDGDVEALRSEVRANMARELKHHQKLWIKNQVMVGLLRLNDIELPQTLVQDETDRLRHQAGEPGRQSPLPATLFEDEARRRVGLGLLVGEIIKRNHLKLDQAKVEDILASLAATYEDPQQVVNAYRASREAMINIEAAAMEEQVVEWVLERAQVVNEPMSFAEVAKRAAGEDEVNE